MKNYFKTQLLIQNIPEQEDHIEEENFKRDYLSHSYWAAREKFNRDKELIKSGKLLQDIIDPAFSQVTIHTKILFVQVKEGHEKETVVNTSDTNEPTSDIAEAALDRDNINAQREYKKGHVRHTVPIEDIWHFEVERIKQLPGAAEEVEIKRLKLSIYEEVQSAFREMSYLFYWEENEISGYDPEYGESLIIRKFLVHKDGDEESRLLLVENKDLYPLDPALAIEIEDKFNMECLAARNRKEGPFYGKNEVIYEIEPAYRKQQRELKDPKVTFAVLLTFGDRNSPEFSEMIPYLYDETGGEDLFVAEEKAYEFYRDRYYDRTEGQLSSKIASALGSGDYFIRTILFTYHVDNEEHFHNLYQENTLDLDPEHAPRLKEIKENRRDHLNLLNPNTEEDYNKIGDSLEVLKEIKKQYIVFKGDNWVRPEKERIFYHHNLVTARKAALHFYEQAKEEEHASASPHPVSLIIYASDLRDNPYYIASTSTELQQYIEFGHQQERKFYEQLGYRISNLEHEE